MYEIFQVPQTFPLLQLITLPCPLNFFHAPLGFHSVGIFFTLVPATINALCSDIAVVNAFLPQTLQFLHLSLVGPSFPYSLFFGTVAMNSQASTVEYSPLLFEQVNR